MCDVSVGIPDTEEISEREEHAGEVQIAARTEHGTRAISLRSEGGENLQSDVQNQLQRAGSVQA